MNNRDAQTATERKTTETSPYLKTHSWFVKFSILEQALIAKRLSFLIQAGTPLRESLEIIRAQSFSSKKAQVLQDITHRVMSGTFLSTSLEAYGTLFHPLTITLIRIGEHTGSLGHNLSFLASELRKRHALTQKIRGALIYPLLVTCATVGVAGGLIMFIFPKLMPIFQSLQIDLPFATEALIEVSSFLGVWWLHLTIGLCIAMLLYSLLRAHLSPFRRITDTLPLSLPHIGKAVKLYNAAQFTRTLELTLRAGLPLNEGVALTRDITYNSRYRDIYARMAERILHGERMSTTLLLNRTLFPETLPEMIATAESSGSLSSTLGYVSEFYESEIDELTKNLSHSLEPLLLIIMGLTVGLVAISIITPIYEITHHMQSY